MRLYAFITLSFFSTILTAQEIYLNVGQNFTSYDYTNSNGASNPSVDSSSGNSYELGYVFSVSNIFNVAVSGTIDQYNATGGNYVSNYSWNTTYLGIQGMLVHNLLGASRSDFNLNVNVGLNVNHIINGQQKINGQTFDLVNEYEFNGIFIRPQIGFDAQYFLLREMALQVGTRISKNYGLMQKDEKLHFNNLHLYLGITLSIN